MPLVNLPPEQEVESILRTQSHRNSFVENLKNILEKASIGQELNGENKGELTLYSKHNLIKALGGKYRYKKYEAKILYNITQVQKAIEAILNEL